MLVTGGADYVGSHACGVVAATGLKTGALRYLCPVTLGP